MIADYVILLDANVLANYAVCDLYLRLGEKPRMLIPKWSSHILDEVYRTHIGRLDWPQELADSFQEEINKAYPDALITGYEELIPLMSNDKKDRHVLAAAVRDKVDLIITFNLKDFGDKHLSKWDLEALHPQDYLLSLYSMNPAVVSLKLSKIAKDRDEDLEETILNFGKALPKFSSKLMEDLGEGMV